MEATKPDCPVLTCWGGDKPYGVTAGKEDDRDLWHPNNLGNELLAQEIYNRIKRNPSLQ